MIRIPTNNAMLAAIATFGVRDFTVNVYPDSQMGRMFMMFSGAFNNPEAVQSEATAALPVVAATNANGNNVVVFEADKGFTPDDNPHPSVDRIVKRLNLAYKANERSMLLTASWTSDANQLAKALGLRAVINYNGEHTLADFVKLENDYYVDLRGRYDAEDDYQSNLPFPVNFCPGYTAGMLQRMADNPDQHFMLYNRAEETGMSLSFNDFVRDYNAELQNEILVDKNDGTVLLEPSYSTADGQSFGQFYFKAFSETSHSKLTEVYQKVIPLTPIRICALRDFGDSFTVLPTQSRNLRNDDNEVVLSLRLGESLEAMVINDETIDGTSSLDIEGHHFSDDRFVGEINSHFMLNDPKAIAFLENLGAQSIDANLLFAGIGH